MAIHPHRHGHDRQICRGCGDCLRCVLSRLRFELAPDGRGLTQTFTDYRSGSPVTGVTR